MKIEPVKVVAVAYPPSVPAESGAEKAKEGLTFAKTMENVMGLFDKAETLLALTKLSAEVVTSEGEEVAPFAPDIDLHTILLTPLGPGAAMPLPTVPAAQALPVFTAESDDSDLSPLPKVVMADEVALSRTNMSKSAYYGHEPHPVPNVPHHEASEVPILTPTPTLSALRPAVTPVSLSPIAAPVVVSYPDEVGPLVPRDSIPPVVVEPMRPATANNWSTPETAKSERSPSSAPLLAAHTPPTPKAPPDTNAPTAPPLVRAHISPKEPLDLNTQIFSPEPLLPMAQPVSGLESSKVLPPAGEYDQRIATARPSQSQEANRAQARSSYTVPDALLLDLAGTTAHTQRSAPPLTLEPPAPTFMQRLQTEIISFAAHPTRPELTLEIAPPEYGKVIVSAERERGGLVVVRLITETPQAKTALLEHMPRNTPTLEVRVYTAEEYRDYRDERPREQGRENREQPAKQGQREERMEFKV